MALRSIGTSLIGKTSLFGSCTALAGIRTQVSQGSNDTIACREIFSNITSFRYFVHFNGRGRDSNLRQLSDRKLSSQQVHFHLAG